MAEITKEEMRERLGNIDQIRDIIFGAQLREYDNRFDKIDSDLSMMQQDMQARIEQVKNVLSAEMKAAVDSLEKKVKSLTLNTQEESADLRQQIDRVNRKFSSSIEALDEAIDNQTSSIRDELSHRTGSQATTTGGAFDHHPMAMLIVLGSTVIGRPEPGF